MIAIATIEARTEAIDTPGLAGLEHLLADELRLVHLRRFAARAARTAELAEPLPPAIERRLPAGGLWVHQARAIQLARDGASVVVATGTASGKSLCYQVPIAEAVSQVVRPGTAIALFPTKALGQDQLRSLLAADYPRLRPATYDGDTDQDARLWARSNANVLLTNPEMVHYGILPQHQRWVKFLSRLRYVVIDELHVLRGVFGSHVAHVLRRLRRLCAHYGSEPTFIFTSATIGGAGELAERLCGEPVATVDDDGSPLGERLFALWNPPLLDHRGARASATTETATLVSRMVADDRRVIAFCRSRKGTELVAAEARRRLPDTLGPTVRSYRSGYLAEERREIEDELARGMVRGVVATSALELGVDIGGLEVCVIDGFPGTISSLWQQAGRAGRGAEPSAAVLVAGDDQLDQWLMAHPDEVFTRPPEPVVINPSNPQILAAHLRCAAHELPLTHHDNRYWPDDLDEGVRRLALDDEVVVRRRGRGVGEPAAVWTGPAYPARSIGLRSSSVGEYRIEDVAGELIGTVDGGRAFRVVHEGALYLHQGIAYEVASLDLDERRAVVTPASGDTYTQPRATTEVRLLSVDDSRTIGRLGLRLGSVRVSTQVTGYHVHEERTRRLLSSAVLDLPPTELETRAFWYLVDDELLTDARIADADLGGTLHAIEHAAIGMMPLFTICDRWDVGGVSTPLLADTGLPTIVIYDAFSGGAGVAELGFGAADRHLDATRDLIAGCRCTSGCPSCVQSPKCGNGNDPLDKQGALQLLTVALGCI